MGLNFKYATIDFQQRTGITSILILAGSLGPLSLVCRIGERSWGAWPWLCMFYAGFKSLRLSLWLQLHVHVMAACAALPDAGIVNRRVRNACWRTAYMSP